MNRSDSGALVLRFENSLDDIEAWVDCYYRQSRTMRRAIRRAQVSFILLGLLALAVLPHVWFATLFVLVPMVLLMPRWFYASGRRNARQMYTEGGSPLGLGHQELVATPEGIELRFDKSRHFYDWSLVDKVVHGPHHTFIYIGSVNAVVIPHNTSDAVKREQLVSWIVRSLPLGRTLPAPARALPRSLPDGDV